MPYLFAALITSVGIAFSVMLVNTNTAFRSFFEFNTQIKDQQTAALATATKTASFSNELLGDLAASFKLSVETAEFICVSFDEAHDAKGVISKECDKLELKVDPSYNAQRLDVLHEFINSLISFDEAGHGIFETFSFGLRGARDQEKFEPIYEGFKIELINSSKLPIKVEGEGILSGFADAFNDTSSDYLTTSKLYASTLLTTENPSINKNELYVTSLSGIYTNSANDLVISERLLKALVNGDSKSLRLIKENQEKFAVSIIQAGGNQVDYGLDFATLPNGVRAVLDVVVQTKDESLDNATSHKQTKQKKSTIVEPLKLTSTAQLRIGELADISEPPKPVDPDPVCDDGSLPVNGECPDGVTPVFPPPRPPSEPDPTGTVTEVPDEPQEAIQLDISNFNPDLFDLVTDPSQPISVDNPACIVQKEAREDAKGKKGFTCYHIDEDGNLVIEQGRGFELEEGQEIVPPDQSVNVGIIGDPDAENLNVQEVDLEVLPRNLQQIGKLDLGFTFGDIEIPPGAVVTKLTKGNNTVRIYDPNTGELIAVIEMKDLPKGIRKEINDSIKELNDEDGINITDLFEGDSVEAAKNFLDEEQDRGDDTRSNITIGNDPWHKENKKDKGIELQDGILTINGEEVANVNEDGEVGELVANINGSIDAYWEEQQYISEQKDLIDDMKNELKDAERELKGVKEDLNKKKDKLKNVKDPIKRAELEAEILSLEIQKDDAKQQRDTQRGTLKQTNSNIDNARDERKEAKKQIKKDKKALKNHFKPQKNKKGKGKKK